MLTSLKQKFRAWLFRPKIEQGTILLTQRRIFILPTKQGLVLVLLLIVMLLGDINYNLSLGYMLTFLLAMMAVLSMLYAFRNLAHLEVRAGHATPVFNGDTAYFPLLFSSTLPRYQLKLTATNSSSPLTFDISAKQTSEILFPLTSTQRGWLAAGRLKLYTEFPLGLFHAWSYLHFDTRCLVYPKPHAHAPRPSSAAPDGLTLRPIAGDDDFSGFRNYVPGDALTQVAWKAYASGRGLQVKQFTSLTGEQLWLDLADTQGAELEEKLARMTRWVLDAHTQGLHYGLRLSDQTLSADSGLTHRDDCLRHLALFNLK